jgi:superkiller protein 3
MIGWRRIFSLLVMGLLFGPGTGWSAEATTAPKAEDDVMVQTYRQAISVDPNDVLAHFNLGLALYKLERFDEAQAVLTRCLDLNRADVRAHQQVDGPSDQILGIIYFNHFKDDRKAVDYFGRSLKITPNDADTHYALGMACLRLKAYPDALKSLDLALQNGRTQDAELYFQKALALTELKREPEAIAAYQEALKRKPDYAVALENLALIYHRQGKDDETITTLLRLNKLEPMNFNANYLLGLHYYRKKMYSEMVAAYNRAVAVKPDLSDAHYNLGMAYFYQTRFELAVEELKKAVALNPQDAEAYNLLGQAQAAAVETYLHQGGTYLAQENYADAIAALQKVFTVDANNLKAKELLEDAQRRVREEFAAHMRLGEKFFQENKLEEAYNEFELASRLNPSSPEAQEGRRKAGAQLGQLVSQRMQKAKTAEQLKDFREACVQYASALELRADYAPAKKALAALKQKLKLDAQRFSKTAGQLLEKEQLNEAAVLYKRVLKIIEVTKDDAEQERALAGLTKVNALRAELIGQYLAQGRKLIAGNEAKAKEFFNRVLKLDPQNKTANDFIVKLTGTQSQAKVTDEQIKTTYYRGADFYVNGKIEEAIQEWEKVVALDPENQDAKINIARAKAKLSAIRKLTEGN